MHVDQEENVYKIYQNLYKNYQNVIQLTFYKVKYYIIIIKIKMLYKYLNNV